MKWIKEYNHSSYAKHTPFRYVSGDYIIEKETEKSDLWCLWYGENPELIKKSFCHNCLKLEAELFAILSEEMDEL